ncbi:MAG: hypothetical protein ACEPO8_09870 [Rhodothermaceae bacterium]
MNSVISLFLCVVFLTVYIQNANEYEIKIVKNITVDDESGVHFDSSPNENESLFSWLGGVENIKKILICVPFINIRKINFTEKYIKNRFENANCINSQKNSWHYAPFTKGIIYLKDGSKANFEMYVSGISISNHLFSN